MLNWASDALRIGGGGGGAHSPRYLEVLESFAILRFAFIPGV